MKQYSPDGLPLPDFAVIVTWCVSAGRSSRNHAVLVIPSGAKMYSCENDAKLCALPSAFGGAARSISRPSSPTARFEYWSAGSEPGASFFHFFESG